MEIGKSIRFRQLELVTSPCQYISAYEYRKDRPLRWLQKICIFILGKLKCHYWGETVTLQEIEVNPKKFIEIFFSEISNIQSVFHMKPTRIIMGAKNYAELMSDKEFLNYFHFRTEYKYCIGGIRRTEIVGLKVEIVPWLDGIIVLP